MTKKEIKIEIERLFTLRDIVQSYEEISATRMRRTRDSVLENRAFLNEINQIFHQVQYSYKNEVLRLMKEKKIKDTSKITFLKRNGKTVYVLLSANTGLYGNIVKKTFELYHETIQKKPADTVVIGRLGMSLFQEAGLKVPVTSFEIPDNKIDREEFKKIVEYILRYETIIVFYGLFQTMITQRPVASSISGAIENTQSGIENNIRYIFEPSLEKIMAFFETEIFSSIFEQTIHESELARFSSRMMVLDAANENIKTNIKEIDFERRKQKHQAGNRKQLNRLSGISLWAR